MQTKLVYVLVSDGEDYYFEQALLSLYSARKYNSKAEIEIITDSNTSVALKDKKEKIIEYAASIKVIETPDEGKKYISRYLKTNLRKYVTGDYLFIDCDTVVCGKLDGIDKFEGDICAVSDINGPLPLSDQAVISRCEAAGFSGLTGKPYFNSGVMLVRDTPLTHQFYYHWHTNWLKSVDRGVSFDQPALCQANVEMGEPIRELPGIWNCQFKYRQGYSQLKNAVIMHYFNSNGKKQWTYPTDCLFQSIKEKGYIDATIKQLIDKPKSRLYAVMTIGEEQAYQYFNSAMTDVYVNNPPLFRLLLKVARLLDKPLKALSRIKESVLS